MRSGCVGGGSWRVVLVLLVTVSGCSTTTGRQVGGAASRPVAARLHETPILSVEAVDALYAAGAPEAGRVVRMRGYLIQAQLACPPCPKNTPCSACPPPLLFFASQRRDALARSSKQTVMAVQAFFDSAEALRLRLDGSYVVQGTLGQAFGRRAIFATAIWEGTQLRWRRHEPQPN